MRVCPARRVSGPRAVRRAGISARASVATSAPSAVRTGAHHGRPCSSTTPSRGGGPGPHEPPDDDPERDSDQDARRGHRRRRPPGGRSRAAAGEPERPPDHDVPTANAQHGHERVQQPGDGEGGEERGEHPWQRPGLVEVADLRRQRNRHEPGRRQLGAGIASVAPGDDMLHGRFAAEPAIARQTGERPQAVHRHLEAVVDLVGRPTRPPRRRPAARRHRLGPPTRTVSTEVDVQLGQDIGPERHLVRPGRARPRTIVGPGPAGHGVEGARVPACRTAGAGRTSDRHPAHHAHADGVHAAAGTGRARRRRRPRQPSRATPGRRRRRTGGPPPPAARVRPRTTTRRARRQRPWQSPRWRRRPPAVHDAPGGSPARSRAGRPPRHRQEGRRSAAMPDGRGRTERRVATTRIAAPSPRIATAPIVKHGAGRSARRDRSRPPSEAAWRQHAQAGGEQHAPRPPRRRSPAPVPARRRRSAAWSVAPSAVAMVPLAADDGRVPGDGLGDDHEAGDAGCQRRAATWRRPRRRCRSPRAPGARRPPRGRPRSRAARTARPTASQRLVLAPGRGVEVVDARAIDHPIAVALDERRSEGDERVVLLGDVDRRPVDAGDGHLDRRTGAARRTPRSARGTRRAGPNRWCRARDGPRRRRRTPRHPPR